MAPCVSSVEGVGRGGEGDIKRSTGLKEGQRV